MIPRLALYESLVTDTTDKAMLMKDKLKTINSISRMDNSGKELVYVLIKYHSIQFTNGSENLYGGVIDTVDDETNNLTWDFTKLPNKLQQILLKFTEKERHKQLETLDRQANEIKMKNDNKPHIK